MPGLRLRGRCSCSFQIGLWYDIGPETAAARNALFGFRAELFATGFAKTINDWCRAHRTQLTGHVDQEELVNPVIGQAGDLMKAFKYQDIPAIDQVFQYGRASRAYKVVSSAANNYDRPRVLTECYGGINQMPVANLYKEAMDQFAKGINMMVPHAVRYDQKSIIYQPDLSPSNETRWNAADHSPAPQWLQVEFASPKSVASSIINEPFDRVRGYHIQTWDGANWVDLAKGDQLGAAKSHSFPPVTTTKVRLLIDAVTSYSEWSGDKL